MKKFLYCAAVVALATACTQDDELANIPSSQAQGQGLTFDVTLAGNNTVNTRGELYEDNKTYPFFWYAEQDRIDVFGYNLIGAQTSNVGYGNNTANKGVINAISTTADKTLGDWTLTNGASEYKATQSAGQGKFTAVSDADMLAFDYSAGDPKTATIIATYGDVAVTAAKSEMANVSGTQTPVAGELVSMVLTSTGSNATQKVKNPNQVIAPMYSITSATPAEDYSSVGESANLSLVRPFPVLQFTTANVDKYAEDFGPLKSVTLTTIGKNKAGKWAEENEDDEETGSPIAYATSQMYQLTFEDNAIPEGEWVKTGSNGLEANDAWAATDANTVKVTLSSLENWSDANSVYMTVAPVDRSELKDGDMLKVTYEFDNISFTLDGTKANAKDYETLISKSNWTAYTADGRPNAVTFMSRNQVDPLLDINNYDYLVVGKENEADKTLIVNRGKLKDIFGQKNISGTMKDVVIWPVGTAATGVKDGYSVDNIKRVVINCDVEDAEFEYLNKLTAAEELEMTVETSIPEGGLASLTAVKKLILPKVAEINEDFVSKNFNKLTDLVLSSYPFDESINDRFFNDDTKGTLQYIDLASVEDFGPVYLGRRALIFQGYTVLDSVKVMEGAEMYSQQFDGCVKLQKVIGSVDLEANKATYAFQDCKALQTINVTTTYIPEYAFYITSKDGSNKNLTSVLKDGKQVVPTYVGAYAFMNQDNLQYMDLSQTTKLGMRAFNNSGLAGSSKDSRDLKVGAATIEAAALANTPLTYVHFLNATVIQEKILTGCNLTQIKFNKVFKAGESETSEWGKTDNAAFGNCANTDLLVADGQEFDGATITLGTKAADQKEFTFKAIRVEEPYN